MKKYTAKQSRKLLETTKATMYLTGENNPITFIGIYPLAIRVIYLNDQIDSKLIPLDSTFTRRPSINYKTK